MNQQEKENIMANNMYAQQLNINSKPGQTEVAAKIAANAIKEASRQQGFRGGSVLANSEANHVQATTYWRTQTDMVSNERSNSNYQRQRRDLREVEQNEQAETFEVTLDQHLESS
jgi:heme-degrading monooxygenase HmoA